MRRATKNLLGVAALAAIWALMLDDETRAALSGEKKRDVINVEVERGVSDPSESARSAQALAASRKVSKRRASGASRGKSKSTRSVAASFANTGPARVSGATSEHSAFPAGGLKSCAAESPVNPTPKLGYNSPPKIPAICSSLSLKPLTWFDLESLSWKKWNSSLFTGWADYSEAFPRSGMMHNGIVFQQPPSVPLTSVIGFSSWPTPTVADSWTGNLASSQVKQGSRHSLNLSRAVQQWPTPTARDRRSIKGAQHMASRTGAPGLAETVGQRDGATSGGLNPPWLEWLMGFPAGWTDAKPSGTPSSRKSRNTSADSSPRRGS